MGVGQRFVVRAVEGGGGHSPVFAESGGVERFCCTKNDCWASRGEKSDGGRGGAERVGLVFDAGLSYRVEQRSVGQIMKTRY